MKGYAATLDISRYMNVSAPSVTKMLKKLRCRMDIWNMKNIMEYNLTQKGQALQTTIKQKHGILLDFFEILGIGKEIANQDAEGIEHHLNPKTIRQIRKFVTFFKANPKVVNSFNEF